MLRRVAPAIGLFALSPFVAEYLLGNIAIDAMGIGLLLAPMYGGGAILVREAARRAGRGWPTILLLALAYGLVEEGLCTQTLFNTSYFGFHLLEEAYIPALGIGTWWTLFVLTLHVVWSLCVPIAIVESSVPNRETAPWLGWPGLAVASVLFLLGCAVTFLGTYHQEHFLATPGQLLGAGTAAVAAIASAFLVTPPRLRSDREVPSPWRVGAFSLVATSAFLSTRYILGGWPIVAAYLLLYGLGAACILRWSSREGWGPPHRLALAGGAMLTYAWHAFPQTPVLGSRGTVDLVGNAVFAVVAVVVLTAAWRRVRRPSSTTTESERPVGIEARPL